MTRWKRHSLVVTCILLSASNAMAQAEAQRLQTGVTNLAQTALNILTVVAGIAAVGGFTWAGVKYNSGAPDAKEQFISNVKGSALIGAAGVIAQAIKGFFT